MHTLRHFFSFLQYICTKRSHCTGSKTARRFHSVSPNKPFFLTSALAPCSFISASQSKVPIKSSFPGPLQDFSGSLKTFPPQMLLFYIPTLPHPISNSIPSFRPGEPSCFPPSSALTGPSIRHLDTSTFGLPSPPAPVYLLPGILHPYSWVCLCVKYLFEKGSLHTKPHAPKSPITFTYSSSLDPCPLFWPHLATILVV